MGIDVLLILNPFLFIEQHTSLARTCFFVSFVSDIPKIITLFCNYTNNSSFFLFVCFVCALLFESKVCFLVQELIVWDYKAYDWGKHSPPPASKLRTIQPVAALYFVKMRKSL